MHEEREADLRSAAVTEVVAELSADRQALIYALFVLGLSNREYAIRKGVNESSVRRQLNRTLKTIKRALDGSSQDS